MPENIRNIGLAPKWQLKMVQTCSEKDVTVVLILSGGKNFRMVGQRPDMKKKRCDKRMKLLQMVKPEEEM